MAKVGDKVTYYFWTNERPEEGVSAELHSAPAVITALHEPEIGLPQAVALEVEMPPEIVAREGYTPTQSHSYQRVRAADDIYASGTWSPLPT